MRTPTLMATALALTCGACVIVTDDDADLTVHNHSDFVLTAVYVADVGDPSWGPNLLGSALYPGDDVVIRDLGCGHYDVRVVDRAGVSCELHDLGLCFHDEGWIVTNTTLAACAFRG